MFFVAEISSQNNIRQFNSQTIYLPYEIKHLTGMVANLPNVYGKNSSKVAQSIQSGGSGRAAGKDQFAELE